jgi:predicted nuclease of predicted toxin-antitoxin system
LRVLLDENVDRRLKRDFAEGHEIVTVAEAGWAGKSNGELLRLAEREFDVLLSTDKGIPHQQNVSRFDLAVILLRARSNAQEDLAPLMDEVDTTLASIEPGTVVRISSDRATDR